MLALLVPFYVCSDVFFCSCFFSFGESSSSQLTFVFPLIGLVLPLLFSRLPCFSFFSFLLLLHLFFCCFFFFFFFFFFFLFLAPLFCGANCDGGVLPGCSGVCSVVLCFWDRPSRMDIRRQKRKSCALFLGTFAFDAFCQKNFLPLVFGVLFRPSRFIKVPFIAWFCNP